MAEVGALVYKFSADLENLKSGFSQVQAEFDKLKANTGVSNDNFKKFGKDAAQSIGLAKHEMVNLSRQIQDVGVSLASGQSPFMVLVQQGTQIADIFSSNKNGAGAALKGFASQIASVAASSKSVMVGLVAAVAAVGVTAYASEKSLEKLADTAKALGTSRGALREFGRQASILGLDPEKANEDLVALAQRLREAQISGGDLSVKLKAIGIDLKSFDLSKPGEFARLFEQIATKVRSGSNELDKLNALKLLGLSEEFKRVFEQGSDAIHKFAKNSEGAIESSTKTIIEKQEYLKAKISDIVKYLVDAATNIAYAVASAIEKAIDKISGLIEYAKQKWAEFKSAVFGGENDYKAPETNKNQERIIDVSRSGGSTDLSKMFAKPSSKSGGKSAGSDELTNYIKGLREAADIAKSQVENFGRSNAELAKSEALIKAENIAKEQGKKLTDAQRAEISNLSASEANSKKTVDDLKDAQDRLNDSMAEFADTVTNSLDDLIIRGAKAKDVLKDLLSTLASSALRGLLTGEGGFGNAMGLGGKDGATGGLLGSVMGLAKGGLGGGLGSLFSMLPKFAAGGSLPAGKWGIAGEAGPELIQGPATITPMGKTPPANIQIHNYAGAKVETQQMSDGQIMVLIKQAIDANNRKVPGIVADAQRRAM